MEECIKCNCEICGIAFERPAIYQKYLEESKRGFYFRTALAYCDKCRKQKIKQALKRLPEILEILSKEE